MKILILRHAEAMNRNPKKFPDDGLRPLTKTGQEKSAEVAQVLRKSKTRFDMVFSSPLLRAQQTANIVRKELHLAKSRLVFTDHLAPLGDLDLLVEEIRKLDPISIVLLVGHEPELSELISIFLSGGRSLSIVMKKGGLCCLSMDEFEAGKYGTLEWLLTPAQLSKLQ